MKYSLLVTGPAYGTQQASSAYQFAQALIAAQHELVSVFFYGEGIHNANALIAPANDEVSLLAAWQKLHQQHDVKLNLCVAAALRRGVVDQQEAEKLHLPTSNLAEGFTQAGLGALAEAALTCDRLVQF